VERMPRSADRIRSVLRELASENLTRTLGRMAPLAGHSLALPNDFLRGQPGATDVISQMETRIVAGDDEAPYFAVGFRNGSVRAVFPADGDAMGYRQQILAKQSGHSLFGSEPEFSGARINQSADANRGLAP
jgi:hypothetical protein